MMTDGVPRSVRTKSSSAVAVPDHEGTKVMKAIIVQTPLEEAFAALFKSDFVACLFPVKSVTRVKGGKFHWLLHDLPEISRPVEWIAQVLRDKPRKMFSWRTLDPSDIASAGSVWLKERPEKTGTEIRVNLKYDIPNEFLKVDFERAYGNISETVIHEGLRRLKALLEAGELATVEGQTHGGQEFKA